MKPLTFRSFILISLYLFLSACGNKGDLYLPEKTQETKQDTKEIVNKDTVQKP